MADIIVKQRVHPSRVAYFNEPSGKQRIISQPMRTLWHPRHLPAQLDLVSSKS
jgi:hypothetical protein